MGKAETNRNRAQDIAFALALCLLCLGKLFLIHDDEIVARIAPKDNSWFAKAALSLIQGQWLGSYDALTLIRPPGYPLAIWWNQWTGLPLRLGHELWLMIAALYFAFSFKTSRTVTFVLTALIVLHPVGFIVGNETEGENLYTPLFIFFVGALVRSLRLASSSVPWMALLIAGLSAAFLAITREESQMLLVLLAAFALLLWIRRIKGWFLLPLIPAVLLFAGLGGVRWINWAWYGSPVFSEQSLDGFEKLNRALLKIQAGPARRYVAINREARELAYAASPTFRELEPGIEGNHGSFWQKVGCQMGGSCEDISTGWFIWAVRGSATDLGYHQSVVKADAFYRQAATELELACIEGSLPCGAGGLPIFGFLSFKGIDWTFLPPSFKKIAGLFVYSGDFLKGADDVDPSAVQMFDRVANRRDGLSGSSLRGKVSVHGWALTSGDVIQRIEIFGADGKVYGATESFRPRDDISSHFRQKGFIENPTSLGFHLEASIDAPQPIPIKVRFLTAAGAKVEKHLMPLYEEGLTSIFCIEAVEGIQKTWSRRSKQELTKVYNGILWVLPLAAVLALLIMPIFGKKLAWDGAYWSGVAILFLAVASRFGLFVVLDAFSFPVIGSAQRYLYPVMGLYSCLLVVISYGAYTAIRGGGRSSRSPIPRP